MDDAKLQPEWATSCPGQQTLTRYKAIREVIVTPTYLLCPIVPGRQQIIVSSSAKHIHLLSRLCVSFWSLSLPFFRIFGYYPYRASTAHLNIGEPLFLLKDTTKNLFYMQLLWLALISKKSKTAFVETNILLCYQRWREANDNLLNADFNSQLKTDIPE